MSIKPKSCLVLFFSAYIIPNSLYYIETTAICFRVVYNIFLYITKYILYISTYIAICK